MPQSWQPKGFTTSDIFVKIPGLFHLEETNKYLVHFLTRKRYACLLVHIFFSRIFGRKCYLIFYFHVHIDVFITVCVVRIRFGSAIGPRPQQVFLTNIDAWWQLFWGSFCWLHLPVLNLSGQIKTEISEVLSTGSMQVWSLRQFSFTDLFTSQSVPGTKLSNSG